jgi:hypothetical protein
VAAPDSVYVNDAIVTTQPNIDATTFINGGLIFFDTIDSNIVNGSLFQTQDTLYVTNTGTIFGQPGFIFDYHNATGSHPASSFNDSGTITALDSPPVAFLALGGRPATVVPSQPPGEGGAVMWNGGTAPYLINSGGGTNVPMPSAIIVSANNITVSGTLAAGDLGDLQLNGAYVNLRNGTLASGLISEVDTNAEAARGVVMGYATAANVVDAFYSPPASTYDIFWTLDNGSSYQYDVEYMYDGLYLPSEGLNEVIVYNPFPVLGNGGSGSSRNGTVEGYPTLNYGFDPEDLFPISTMVPVAGTTTTPTPAVAANWLSYVYDYAVVFAATPKVTDYYYNIIFVNSAFADTNVTAEVLYNEDIFNTLLDEPTYYPGNEYSMEGMVKFSATMTDALTGLPVTNSIYVLDTTGYQVPEFYATNSVYSSLSTGMARPLGIEITRNQPMEWTSLYSLPADDIFDPSVIYAADEFKSDTLPMTNVFYGVQVGRNPETRNGLDPYSQIILGASQTGMPDITNEPGRIEIHASQTNDVSNLKIRANGFVTITAPNFVGTPAAVDFGNYSVDLGNLGHPLLISNLFPSSFSRLRGDIAVYTSDWVNAQTNDSLTTNYTKVTNNFHIHVLIVDQDLRSTFQTTGLNVALRGNKVVLDDPVRVMGNFFIQTYNLTVNSNLILTGNAGTLLTSNAPLLQNLLVGPAGSIGVDNYINLGVVPSASPARPSTLNTPILSITNLGQIHSGETELQSQIFALGGGITASNGGSIVLNAITNFLGAGALGLPNSLTADADINLTAASIQLTNSTIMAGQLGRGQLVLSATGELTDHLPNTASTRYFSTNFIRVTDGFSLLSKPASGDLFGTQITTLAANPYQTITHVWAGQDLGPAVAGFFNNAVIGHLILDRTADGATFEFSAAGKKNAMYVDYLELQDLSFSDYHHGLVVDPNFTIYYANANVPPSKLQSVYSNIVWVPQFAGPNSTVRVAYLGGSNCLMNAALATSDSIDSAHSGIVNLDNPHPLNNPSVGPIPCPSLVSSTETFSVSNGLPGQSFVIWTEGQGAITPNLSLKGVKAGQTNTLYATPASGWLFQGWSGPAVAGQPASVSNSPTLMFVTPTNIFSFLTATFVTNPFIALAGSYNGLFSVSAAVAPNDSGFVTFTLNSQGVFSGKLRIGATTNYPFSSQFNVAQSATAFATNGTNVLTVALQVGKSSLPDKATGSVTNAKFNASLVAYHTPPWTASQPAPQAGSYTLVLPGNASAAASPGGDSYGTVTVDMLGNLTAAGTLADNLAFSQSVPLSKEGQWPLYFTPAGVPQSLLGTVTFDTNGLGGRPAQFKGSVTWIRAAGPGTLYTNGFTNTSGLLGSTYSAPYQTTNGLALSNPSVTLSGGNLPAEVSDPVSLLGLESYQTADKSLTLTIAPASGSFTFQYVAPGTTKKVTGAGVVLQNQGQARGFFLGTNQSGAVLLQGN